MSQQPKIDDIGVLTLAGMSMEVKLSRHFDKDDPFVYVSDARGKRFLANKKCVQWDKLINLVDKPITLDPAIDWHNDLDQESLKQGYRPLVKGEDKEFGDEFLDSCWLEIGDTGTTYLGTKYRTKRPLSDAIHNKRKKLEAEIKEYNNKVDKLRAELDKLNN